MTTTSLTPNQIIDKINNVGKLEDILDVKMLKDEYRGIAAAIHPDVCKLPGADKAFSRLNELKDSFENGISFKDECGEVHTDRYKAEFTGFGTVYAVSKKNYDKLMTSKDEHFKKYLPKSVTVAGDKMTVEFHNRAVPLSKLNLEQKHTNWVLSRMLEFALLISKEGYTHMAINPETIFVIPENHGIVVTTFYHMTKTGDKAGTICGRYKSWYPKQLFTNKIAEPGIDIDMAKKVAAVLLGDPTGGGAKLRTTHNKDFISFLMRYDAEPFNAYDSYRKMLSNNFNTKEFHILNI